jgi:hypothetical protein
MGTSLSEFRSDERNATQMISGFRIASQVSGWQRSQSNNETSWTLKAGSDRYGWFSSDLCHYRLFVSVQGYGLASALCLARGPDYPARPLAEGRGTRRVVGCLVSLRTEADIGGSMVTTGRGKDCVPPSAPLDGPHSRLRPTPARTAIPLPRRVSGRTKTVEGSAGKRR